MKNAINVLLLMQLFYLENLQLAYAAGKIGYGSRAGMTVTVVSMSGIGGESAVIRTKHTRDDAISYCKEYVGKVSKKCIDEELATRLNDEVRANCTTGRFTNFWGEDKEFLGAIKPRNEDMRARYAIKDRSRGELMDGNDYSTNMGIFRALCPAQAPSLLEE